jgi:hypothetical protein
MYILLVGYLNGDVDYFGPFQTEDRATLYAQSVTRDLTNVARWFVKPLIIPHCSRNVMG